MLLPLARTYCFGDNFIKKKVVMLCAALVDASDEPICALLPLRGSGLVPDSVSAFVFAHAIALACIESGQNDPVEMMVDLLAPHKCLSARITAEIRSRVRLDVKSTIQVARIIRAKKSITDMRRHLCVRIWRFSVRPLLLRVCVALQSLSLPAYVLLAMLDHCHRWAPTVAMHIKWNAVCTIKHFNT